MAKYIFRGFDNPIVPGKRTWYGDGKFIVGEIYERVSDIDYYASDSPDAIFTDANGMDLYEDMIFFDEVEE